jgi:hypothetical protein
MTMTRRSQAARPPTVSAANETGIFKPRISRIQMKNMNHKWGESLNEKLFFMNTTYNTP